MSLTIGELRFHCYCVFVINAFVCYNFCCGGDDFRHVWSMLRDIIINRTSMRTIEIDDEFVPRLTVCRDTRESQCYLILGIALYR